MRDVIQRLRLERKLALLFFCAVLLLAALLQFIRGHATTQPSQTGRPISTQEVQ